MKIFSNKSENEIKRIERVNNDKFFNIIINLKNYLNYFKSKY